MANNKNIPSRRTLFDGSASDQNRASWSESSTKLLLELLVVEKNCGNWSGKTPTGKGYQNIINSFQEKMMITFSRQQLKSKCEFLRSSFSLWTNMFIGQTGAGYNTATGAMTMESAWWDNKIKQNSAYQKFKDRGLENAALMYEVFGDNNATGEYQYTPTAANPMFRNSQVLETEANDSSPPRTQYVNENDEVNSPIRTRDDSGRSRLSGGKRKSSSSSQDTWNQNLVNSIRQEFGSSSSTPLEYTIKHVHVDTDGMEEAMDILYRMELESDLFDGGLTLIMDEKKRFVFLKLRNDADRLRWLQKNVN